MIIGLLLGVSLAVTFASLGLIIMGASGVIRENIITGSVIGTAGVVSYSVVAFFLSLIAVFFLVLILKNPMGSFGEY